MIGVGQNSPCYWNGKSRIDLPLPTGVSINLVNFITVVDGDVYAAGYYYDIDGTTACYWKNGVRTDLPGNSNMHGFAVGDNVLVVARAATRRRSIYNPVMRSILSSQRK